MNKIDTKPDGTVEMTIQVPWSRVAQSYDAVLTELTKTVEIEGFRKGKAPKAMVEKKLDKNKVYEEVLQKLIPEVYQEAITEFQIKPVIMPKITLKEAQENKDWTIIAATCQRPEVKLGSYKEKLKLSSLAKKPDLWVPGKDMPDTKKSEQNKPTLDEMLQALLDAVEIKIPDVMIENEVSRMLSELIDQTKKLGLSVDQYLSSTHKSADELKAEYRKQAIQTLSLEFALEEIAASEKITVTDGEIDTAISKAKSPEEKESLAREKYYLASVLRRQKTLDYLSKLAV